MSGRGSGAPTRVLLFARARELAGTRSLELPDLGEGATAADAVTALIDRFGDEFGRLCATCTVVVDGEQLRADETGAHPAGRELAILPPVSGGAHALDDEHERVRVAVLTVSDRAARGDYADETGPAVEALAADELGAMVVDRCVVPDERGRIEYVVSQWCDGGHVDLVLTSGGTGLAPRDVTPEAVRAVLDVEAPGVPELMRAAGTAHTALAALSRQVAGRRGRTLVVTLPGSPGGATDSLRAVLAILPHAVAMARGPA